MLKEIISIPVLVAEEIMEAEFIYEEDKDSLTLKIGGEIVFEVDYSGVFGEAVEKMIELWGGGKKNEK